jgi:hypothetical protein
MKFLAATALALMALTTTAHGQMLMTTRYLALPPAEYDYPYQGQLTLARADARTMSAVCPCHAWLCDQLPRAQYLPYLYRGG